LNSTTLTSTKGDLLLASLAKKVIACHGAITSLYGSALEQARDAGLALNEAKDTLPHGAFLPWVKTECRVGERQARRYMTIAKGWPMLIDSKSDLKSDLTISAAVALLTHNEAEEDACDADPLPEGPKFDRRLIHEIGMDHAKFIAKYYHSEFQSWCILYWALGWSDEDIAGIFDKAASDIAMVRNRCLRPRVPNYSQTDSWLGDLAPVLVRQVETTLRDWIALDWERAAKWAKEAELGKSVIAALGAEARLMRRSVDGEPHACIRSMAAAKSAGDAAERKRQFLLWAVGQREAGRMLYAWGDEKGRDIDGNATLEESWRSHGTSWDRIDAKSEAAA
jgi:hypothetical protein